MNNPFAIFGLTVDFNLDQNLLSERYLSLQKSLHPDNFADQSAQQQRLAVQKSAEINDAMQQLKDPISRADAIIALHQNELITTSSGQDGTFLLQQLEWREQLADIEQSRDEAQLEQFSQHMAQVETDLLQQIAQALADTDWQQAQLINDRLRFMKKLRTEIERVEELLLDF